MAEANMAAVERIKAAKSKSLRLMQMDKKLDSMAKGVRGKITESLSNEEPIEPQQMMATKIDKPMGIPTSGRMNESVPLAIREAFQKNPIDEGQLLMGTMTGGGDLSFLNENVVRPTTTVPVMENTQQTQPQIQSVSAGVDYPMIRTIVEEIVRKYAQSLNKRIMNESKETVNEVNTIALGKTFKFLAKNGDIYEAKLTKVGNINDKRKSVTD